MNQRRALPRIGVPLALTVILLCARLAAVPPLTDPVRGTVSPSLHLVTPWLYFVLAPAFTLWDGLSMLSMSRLQGFLTGLVILYLIWRAVRITRGRRRESARTLFGLLLTELSILGISLALLIAFLAAGALWHRPMLSLAGTDPEDVVVDFHSHTNASHDVQNTWMRASTPRPTGAGTLAPDSTPPSSPITIRSRDCGPGSRGRHPAREPPAVSGNRSKCLAGSHRAPRRFPRGGPEPLQRLSRRATYIARHQRFGLWGAFRGFAPRVSPEPLGSPRPSRGMLDSMASRS